MREYEVVMNIYQGDRDWRKAVWGGDGQDTGRKISRNEEN